MKRALLCVVVVALSVPAFANSITLYAQDYGAQFKLGHNSLIHPTYRGDSPLLVLGFRTSREIVGPALIAITLNNQILTDWANLLPDSSSKYVVWAAWPLYQFSGTKQGTFRVMLANGQHADARFRLAEHRFAEHRTRVPDGDSMLAMALIAVLGLWWVHRVAPDKAWG